jgi:capsular polysaccharide biosynthesis protein
MVKRIRRGWKAGLAAALAVMVGVAVYLFVATPAYTATAVVALLPQPNTTPSGELVRISVPAYAKLASSDAVAASVADRFDVGRHRVDRAIQADVPPGTNTVLVSARWPDPGVASDLANGVVDELLAFSENDPLLRSMLVAPALPPSSPGFPSTGMAIALGLLLAVGVGAAVATASSRRSSGRD